MSSVPIKSFLRIFSLISIFLIWLHEVSVAMIGPSGVVFVYHNIPIAIIRRKFSVQALRINELDWSLSPIYGRDLNKKKTIIKLNDQTSKSFAYRVVKKTSFKKVNYNITNVK
jgi:hypothetical protein